MAKRHSGQSCLLCAGTSTRRGEHVWPLWFIGDFEGEGPFYSEKAGQPYVKRDQTTAEFEALPGTHVPMCEACNGRLNSLVEEPGKPVVRKVLRQSGDDSWPTLTADEAAAFGRWLLKVGLLLSHPTASDDNPHASADKGRGRRDDYDPAWIQWLKDGADPPDHFSVYVTRRCFDYETPWPKEKERIFIPERTIIDGVVTNYLTRSFGFRGVEAVIVWHPGWPINHPLVTDGRAAVLWPNPDSVDLGTLGEVHPGEYGVMSLGTIRATGREFAQLTAEPLEVGQLPGSNAFEVFTEVGSGVSYGAQ